MIATPITFLKASVHSGKTIITVLNVENGSRVKETNQTRHTLALPTNLQIQIKLE